MRGLLSFVVRNDHSPSNYSSAHFEELQLLVNSNPNTTHLALCVCVCSVQALSCLCTLGPLCLEQYMVCQGNTRLLLILEWCHSSTSERRYSIIHLQFFQFHQFCLGFVKIACSISSLPCVCVLSGEFKGHGNAFHGRGGWGGRLAQLRMGVHALLSVCRTRDEAALQDLHDQGAIPLLIGQSGFRILFLLKFLYKF